MGEPVALRAEAGSIPEWLEKVIAKCRSEHPPVRSRPSGGLVGELVIAAAPGVRRHVLITSRDGDTLTVLLATNRTEMATDLDVIVTGAESSAPYDLLVQGELYGSISAEQVGSLVGRFRPTPPRPWPGRTSPTVSRSPPSPWACRWVGPTTRAADSKRRNSTISWR